MTDKQIIKAWEKILATGDAPVGEHWSCGGVVTTKLAKETFDMLNRQKAEIERLQKIIVGFMDEVGTWSNKYDVDISNIHKLPLLAKEDFNIKNKIKSEAIKEFVNQAEELTFPMLTSATLEKKECIYRFLDILNEVKTEMVGDDNA